MNAAAQVTAGKILTVMHIYYLELLPELLDCLRNLEGREYDLYVTCRTEILSEVREQITSFKEDATVLESPNRGYDLAPFCEVLSRLTLDDYAYVIKLHTKRDFPQNCWINGYDVALWKWRERLLSFIKTKDNLDRCIAAFKQDPSLGLASNYALISVFNTEDRNPDREYLNKVSGDLLAKAGLTPYPAESYAHVAGTMFICRAALLKPLVAVGLTPDDFETAKRGGIRDLAHATEVLIGRMITAQTVAGDDASHYRIDDPYTPAAQRHQADDLMAALYRNRLLRKALRFVFRSDIKERDGRYVRRICICKIPVSTKVVA